MNDRAQILKDWRAQEERKEIWVAQQVGCSPQWLSYVLKGRKPLSDKLARSLRETLGILLVDESQALGHGHHQKARVKTTQRTGPERVREGSR